MLKNLNEKGQVSARMGCIVEKREEICSLASKLVSIKLWREFSNAAHEPGVITGFECNCYSKNCDARCTYRMLLEDI